MATPEEMAATMIANMPEKTGKPMEDWLKIVSASGLEKHGAIMDKYDPEKRVNLAVDEWGIWTDVEPGTNPGFLYQ